MGGGSAGSERARRRRIVAVMFGDYGAAFFSITEGWGCPRMPEGTLFVVRYMAVHQ